MENFLFGCRERDRVNLVNIDSEPVIVHFDLESFSLCCGFLDLTVEESGVVCVFETFFIMIRRL